MNTLPQSHKIAIASDHAGFELKQLLIESLSSDLEIEDLGTDSLESCDFPDYATKVSEFVLNNEDTKGVLICGTGVGMSIAANKVKGIRASNVTNVKTAIQSVEHNDVNVLCLGSENLDIEAAKEITESFLNSSFLNEERYINRINKLS